MFCKNNSSPERPTGPTCKCRLRCYSKDPLQVRINIIERINAFEPKNEQDVYLSGLLSAKKIVRRRNLNSKNSTEDPLRKKIIRL